MLEGANFFMTITKNDVRDPKGRRDGQVRYKEYGKESTDEDSDSTVPERFRRG